MGSVQGPGQSPQHTFTLVEDKKRGRLVLKKDREEIGSVAINIVKKQPGLPFLSEMKAKMLNLFGKKFVQRIDNSTDNKKITYVNINSILKLAKKLGLGDEEAKQFKHVLLSQKTGNFSGVEDELIRLAKAQEEVKEIKNPSNQIGDSALQKMLSDRFGHQTEPIKVTVYRYKDDRDDHYVEKITDIPENRSSQVFVIEGRFYRDKDGVCYFQGDTPETPQIKEPEIKRQIEMAKSKKQFEEAVFKTKKHQPVAAENENLRRVLHELDLEIDAVSEVTIHRQKASVGQPNYFADEGYQTSPVTAQVIRLPRGGESQFYFQEINPHTGKPIENNPK